jgi:hypothetical protein
MVSGLGQPPGPQPATASEINHQSVGNTLLPQKLQQTRRGPLRKASKPDVMNVSQILFIRVDGHVSEYFTLSANGKSELTAAQSAWEFPGQAAVAWHRIG